MNIVHMDYHKHTLMIIHTQIHSPEQWGEFTANTGGIRLGVSWEGDSIVYLLLFFTWLALECVESWVLFKQ